MNIFSCSFYWLVFITGGLKNRASESAAEEVAGESSLWQPKPLSATPHPPGCQWVEGPLIWRGQVGGVILFPFDTHQSCLGAQRCRERVSRPGLQLLLQPTRGSFSRCSRAVNATVKPDSSCAGWKGREVLQCLPHARDSMQIDQTELGWILLH